MRLRTAVDFHPRLRGGRPWGSREDRNPAAVFRAAVNGYLFVQPWVIAFVKYWPYINRHHHARRDTGGVCKLREAR